jgi:hypothetical protein
MLPSNNVIHHKKRCILGNNLRSKQNGQVRKHPFNLQVGNSLNPLIGIPKSEVNRVHSGHICKLHSYRLIPHLLELNLVPSSHLKNLHRSSSHNQCRILGKNQLQSVQVCQFFFRNCKFSSFQLLEL